MAKAKKYKKKGKGKKVIKVMFAVIFIIAVVTAVVNYCLVSSLNKKAVSYKPVEFENRIVPVMEQGRWVFKTDRELRVMHLTDVHIGGGYMSYTRDLKAINTVAAMITAEKPDLVIVTGDIAYPVPFQAGTFNNKSGAQVLINTLENLGVYWTVTLGNHDSEAYSYYNREKVSGFYEDESLKYCLYQPGPEDVDGKGNYVIEVKNSCDIITQAFVMLDSHSYTDGDYFGIWWKYDNIHQNQVDWYESEILRMNKENENIISQLSQKGEYFDECVPVKTLAFFHIPLVEFKEAWDELEANGFKDTDNVKYIDGIIGETGKRIFSGIGEDNLFEKMVELGSTKAMFNGHDHYNNVTISRDDIIFSYGYTVDYLAYIGVAEEGSQRGCTMITVKPDTTFEINKYNYYSDRYNLKGFARETVEMQFEDVTYQVPLED